MSKRQPRPSELEAAPADAAWLERDPGRIEFKRRFGPLAKQVHELLDRPGVRERFQEHRKRQPIRRDWRFPPPDAPMFSLTDKYIWLGTIHDRCCCPNEPVFADDLHNPDPKLAALTEAAPLVFLGGNARQRAKKRREIESFLPDVAADLEANPPAGDGQTRKTKRKRGAMPWRDAKKDRRIYEARQQGASYKELAREFFGDETETRKVAKAIDSHRKKLERMGRK